MYNNLCRDVEIKIRKNVITHEQAKQIIISNRFVFVCFCRCILFCLLCLEKTFSCHGFTRKHLFFRCMLAGCNFAHAVSVSRQTGCRYNQYHCFFCSVNRALRCLSLALIRLYRRERDSERHLRIICFYTVFTLCNEPVCLLKKQLRIYGSLLQSARECSGKKRHNRRVYNYKDPGNLRCFYPFGRHCNCCV